MFDLYQQGTRIKKHHHTIIMTNGSYGLVFEDIPSVVYFLSESRVMI